jgi:hypothetical protein
MQDEGIGSTWYWGNTGSPLSPANVSSGWWEQHPNGANADIIAWASTALLQSLGPMVSIAGVSTRGLKGGCPVPEQGNPDFAIGSALEAVPKGSGQQYACACEAPGMSESLPSVCPC